MKKRIFVGVALLIGGGTFWAVSSLIYPNRSGLLQEPEKVLVQVETPEQHQRQVAAAERLRQPEQANPFSTGSFVFPVPTPSASPDGVSQATPLPTATPKQEAIEAPEWVADERLAYALAKAREIVNANPTIGLRRTPEGNPIDVFFTGDRTVNTLRNEKDRIVITVPENGTATVHVVEQDIFLFVVADGSYYVVKNGSDNNAVEYLNSREHAEEVEQIHQRLVEDFRAVAATETDPEEGQRQDNPPESTPIPTPTASPSPEGE